MKKTRNQLKVLIPIAVFILTFATVLFFTPKVAPGTEPTETGLTLGFFTVIPVLLAVFLAFVTSNVVLSLFAGCLTAFLLVSKALGQGGNMLFGFADGIVGTVTDPENAKVLILCIAIGALVEIIHKIQGFEALAVKMSKTINSPKKANLIGELLGVIIFFDDYANALIIGPVMRPVCDKVGISRERLSYIVDSTAAPVTGIALVSSWVAVEVSVINEGLQLVGAQPNGFSLFLQSIPYSFYCILCLIFVLMTSLTEREFGPMLAAEKKARAEFRTRVDEESGDEVMDRSGTRIFISVSAIVVFVAVSIILFWITGSAVAPARSEYAPGFVGFVMYLANVLGYSDTIGMVMISGILSGMYAIGACAVTRIYGLKDGIEAWLKGAGSVMPTVILLVLAWTLADASNSVGTVYYIVDIISHGISPLVIPAAIFATCCLVSFAFGSFGCMFVVMPIAVPIAYAVSSETSFLVLCIASVITGGIFGDHCSPMTDCTILAAQGSGCDVIAHAKTQMPYAITVALVSILSILLATLHVNVWLILLIGVVLMYLVLRILGKKINV